MFKRVMCALLLAILVCTGLTSALAWDNDLRSTLPQIDDDNRMSSSSPPTGPEITDHGWDKSRGGMVIRWSPTSNTDKYYLQRRREHTEYETLAVYDWNSTRGVYEVWRLESNGEYRYYLDREICEFYDFTANPRIIYYYYRIIAETSDGNLMAGSETKVAPEPVSR